MSLEELAPLLVQDETREFDDPCFLSPSGAQCWTEEDAVDDCIEWLDSEYVRGDSSETN